MNFSNSLYFYLIIFWYTTTIYELQYYKSIKLEISFFIFLSIALAYQEFYRSPSGLVCY